MKSALDLCDLCCVRGARVLFSGLTVSVEPGQMLRVQGRNGAGKTTLLRTVCGLARPERGEVRWQGQRIATLREDFDLQIVYLGHAPALKDELSALENLQASAGLAGLACSAHEAEAALASAGLQGRLRVPVRAMSQGERKRVGMARLALSAPAALWVLDEPFDSLDESACRWLQGLIAAQLGRGGVVVMTSHQGRAWDAAQPQVSITLGEPGAARSSMSGVENGCNA